MPGLLPRSGVGPRPRPSIVVLSFANLSDDREQQYFADGITDDLTTDLSRLADMPVISRNTAFTYRNKPVDTREIGRELGVRYVLEGSVRRSGNQIRVNAQLIDAETDTHLWADRFNHNAGDLFALQDEITGQISVALNLELVAAAATRTTSHPDALDWVLRGRAANSKPPSAESYAEAIGHFERALTLDPRLAEAQSWLATTLINRILDFRSRAAEGDLGRAEELAVRAVAASPRSALAHFAKGQVLRVHGRHMEAIREYETVLALNRNAVGALATIGRCKIFLGLLEEAILAQQEAIRFSPRDPKIWNWYFPDRAGVLAAIAHRGGSRLARKGVECQFSATVSSPLPRFRLCSQRRDRAGCGRISRSPEAERFRSLF
jgi:adenylate cyclase